MSATLLPELAAESIETADRLGRLPAEPDLDASEAEYLLASRLAAIQLVPRLWPIVRQRIARGTTGPAAHHLLSRIIEAVERNLALAEQLKEPARIASGEQNPARDDLAELAAAEHQLRQIRDEAVRLLKIVDAPARWPEEEVLRAARERMNAGERLAAEEFRQSLLDR
jgi:hypothetical protein